MTYTFENIMAADIPAYAIGAGRFATQVGTITMCAGMASRAYSLLGDSFSGEARGAQLGDASTVASAAGSLVDSSNRIIAQLSEVPAALAAAKAKVLAVIAEAAASPAGPMLVGAGGQIIVLPRPDDCYPGVRAGREACGAVLNAKMQAAIALANGEDTKGHLQTCAIGLDLASMLKTIFSPPGNNAPGADGVDAWSQPPGSEEIDGSEPMVASDPNGYYQGLTSYTPAPAPGPASGASGLGAAPTAAAPADAIGGGAIGGRAPAAGGFLGVPGARAQNRDDGERSEVRQWSLTEETDEFWRSPNGPTTNGVLT